MNALSQKIFDEYQVRKTKKQKTRFIEMMQQEIPGLKVEKGGLFGSRNLIVGDPDTARTLITAHYDTCSKLPFPNFIMPKNPLLSVLYGVGLGALIGACFRVAAGISLGLAEVFSGNELVVFGAFLKFEHCTQLFVFFFKVGIVECFFLCTYELLF